MEVRRSCEQVKPEERVVIASLRLQGVGVRRIGRAIGWPPLKKTNRSVRLSVMLPESRSNDPASLKYVQVVRGPS